MTRSMIDVADVALMDRKGNRAFFCDPATGTLHGEHTAAPRPAALPDHAASLGNGGYRTTAARGAE